MRYSTLTLLILLFASASLSFADDLEERVDRLVSRIPAHKASAFAQDLEPNGAVEELMSIGMDAVPYLIPHLPDKRLTDSWRGQGGQPNRQMRVNEVVGFVLKHCCKHDFYIASGRDVVYHLGSAPLEDETQIKLFQKQVERWYDHYHSSDEVSRLLTDVNDWFHLNRFRAYRHFEKTKDPRGRRHLQRRIEFLLAENELNTTSQSEMAACAAALGSIGDEKSIPMLRSVWKHLHDHPINASARIHKLFRVYRARLRIGDEEQAIRDLNMYKERHYATLDQTRKEEFDREYRAAIQND